MSDWKMIYASFSDEEKADFDSKAQKLIDDQIALIKSNESGSLQNKIAKFHVSDSLVKSISSCSTKSYGDGTSVNCPSSAVSNIVNSLQSATEELIKCIRNDIVVGLHNKEVSDTNIMELIYRVNRNSDEDKDDSYNIVIRLSSEVEDGCYKEVYSTNINGTLSDSESK